MSRATKFTNHVSSWLRPKGYASLAKSRSEINDSSDSNDSSVSNDSSDSNDSSVSGEPIGRLPIRKIVINTD